MQEYTTVRGDRCHERAETQLRARVARLESALKAAAEYIDDQVSDLISGYDWLGTGESTRWANACEREATELQQSVLNIAREALRADA